MKTKSIPTALMLLAFASPLVAIPSVVAQTESSPRQRVSFNGDWRFTKGDPADAHDTLSYFKNPAVREALLASVPPSQLTGPQREFGAAVSYVNPSFKEVDWRALSLPHDWGIEGPFDQKLPGESGKLPWAGVGWYRKTLTVPAEDVGKRFTLQIDGAMAYAMVWCNGQFVGGWPYGYSSFHLDLTPVLKPGAKNTLVIRLINPEQSSRWYPGAGIYRNVWLLKTNPVHVAQWGTYITTPEITADQAGVSLKTTVANNSAVPATLTVKTDAFLLDTEGRRAGSAAFSVNSSSVAIPAGQETVVPVTATVKSPKLWSTETPNRYVAVTTLLQDGKVVDTYETTFGIRTIEFTADRGFLLNGQHVPLQGVCNHHDLGALGTAFNFRAAQRQLEIMKEMGVNALRTSHNPPAPELLDLCDRMGILVMDESFDCWKKGKKGNDYNQLWPDWHALDLRAEYHRDRNHPSIILWSIGNEVIELGDAVNGPVIAAELTAIAREEDPTRLTVVGSNNGSASYNGVQKNVGVMGQNYQFGGYGRFKKENPTIPLVGSETSSAVSSRGEYFFQTPEQVSTRADEDAKKAAEKATMQGKPAPSPLPLPPFTPVSEDKSQGKSDFQVSSYDLYGPGWAHTPDGEFSALDQNPSVTGEFVWTGFDYLGEPTPYNGDATNILNFHDAEGRAEMERQLKELGKIRVPSRSSYFGIVDLAGFKKDRFYLYQARWRPDFPMAHILPHWNWPERMGLVTPVYVYTSGDEAELFVNGKSLGRKKRASLEYRLRWNDVIYQPGELKVVSYKNGKEWAQDVMKTTGPAEQLLLNPDRAAILGDGRDLSFVTVTVADKNGLLVPRSKNLVKFEISGPGEIAGVDNGDATSFESFQASERKAYNGLALVIIRAKPGATDPITLRATSAGLPPATTVLQCAPTPAAP